MLSADTIAGFSGSLLQKNFDGAVETPLCHYEWWELCCDANYPLVALAAPRGHAKSTAISFTYVLACMVFRERQYCILVSDTVSQAVQFLGDIKKELYDNDRLRELFKIKEFVKDSEDDIIVECEDGYQFRIQAKGSEQKVRGLKWNNKRPDLIVCDDIENDEIVMNKERREKFRKWFNNALLPSRALGGVVRIVGTVLHADSFLERLMPTVYSKGVITDELKQYSTEKIGGWKSVRYKAHNEDFSAILWPTRFDKAYFVNLRQQYVEQGLPESYSQEYLNIPVDEATSYFKRHDFLPLIEEDKKKKLNYYITADLAISKEAYADYTVFLVAGVDEDRRIHVKEIIRDRLDGREIVDMILTLERTYHPEIFGIEEMQVTKAIGPFLREEMIKSDTFPSLYLLKHGGKDKISRGRSIQARMRAHTVKFNKGSDWYQTFEDECCTFPRSKHDDQVDALSYLGMMLDNIYQATTMQEDDDEEYHERYERNYADTGRSTITGY